MYYFLAFSAAVLIAIMVALNGQLTDWYGLHLANLIVHIVGLVASCVALIIRREHPLRSARGLPFTLFIAGVIGYFTTLFNNVAVSRISVTAILAISLLGQAVSSLVIDEFGFFGMPVRKFSASKLIGLAVTCAGIVLLLSGGGEMVFLPALLSFLAGVTTVTSRQISASLGERTSVYISTWFNYVTGSVVALAVFVALTLSGGAAASPATGASASLWMYLGGAIGFTVIVLSNICVIKMSSLIMTLLMFVGQVFGGVAIDAALSGGFSLRTLGGGVCALLGMALNLWLDTRKKKQSG